MAKLVNLPAWQEEPISRSHGRKNFDCGVVALNNYLTRYARQNHELGISKTFVIVPKATPTVVMGYYSINACQINCEDVPEQALKRVGRYPVPAVLLGRLAVDQKYQGLGLGGLLLLSAGERVLSIKEHIGIRAIVIDAKDEQAACWYERFGAIRLNQRPLSLVLPLDVVEFVLSKVNYP